MMKVAFSYVILTEYLQCITSSSKFKGGANHEYIHISHLKVCVNLAGYFPVAKIEIVKNYIL